MIKKSEIQTPPDKKPLKTGADVSENLIEQLHYLQQTIGNKGVGELIKKNAIYSSSTLQNQKYLLKDEQKKENTEAEHIARDRSAIEKSTLEKILREKDGDIRSLASKKPGADIFANVRAELVYVNLPGNESTLFYHYTKVIDAAVSFDDVNRSYEQRSENRGSVVPLVFSFKIERVDEVLAPKPVIVPQEKETAENPALTQANTPAKDTEEKNEESMGPKSDTKQEVPSDKMLKDRR
jgi:hypothetical protein